MRWDLPEMECLILYANANLHGNTELTIVNQVRYIIVATLSAKDSTYMAQQHMSNTLFSRVETFYTVI